jgi:pyruvate formate lyase activating enzyme
MKIGGVKGKMPGEKTGCVLRVEKTSIHDGEGLRSVVFFKGCPMRCAWCSTPESQNFEAEIGIDSSKCICCGTCVSACPSGAISMEDVGLLVLREICSGCFACAEACPKRAIIKYGHKISVREIVEEACKDEIFYFHSGGGVTLSGGEPCAQPKYSAALLGDLKAVGINTALETALNVKWENIELLLPYLDHIFADIKHMNTEKHERFTGVDNSLILDNIRRIDMSGFQVNLTLRVPLIPTVNDDDENLTALAELSLSLKNKLQCIEVLPYHRLGLTTYGFLKKSYHLESVVVSQWDEVVERALFLQSNVSSVPVTIGGAALPLSR